MSNARQYIKVLSDNITYNCISRAVKVCMALYEVVTRCRAFSDFERAVFVRTYLIEITGLA